MPSALTKLTPEQLLSTPVQPPPKGIQSNFGDAENSNGISFGLISPFLAITVCFFVNRIYTKSCIVRKFSWDDVTITLALLGSIVMFVASIWGGKRGRFGNHSWDVSIAQSTSKDFMIPAWIMSTFPPIIYLFLKNTFFIMYLNIFGPLRWMRICAYTSAAVSTVFYISVAVAMFVFATPLHGDTWSEHLFSKEELRSSDTQVPISSFGVVVDLVILVLPIIAVMQLHLPTRRKVGLICIFMTGSLACIFSMLGIYFRNIQAETAERAWNFTAVDIVTLLEVFVGIICACTPAAARSCNYHLRNLSAFKRFVVTQLSRISLSTKQSQATLQPREGGQQPGHYSNFGVYQGPGHTGKAQSKNIQTFIKKGKQHDVENDGIYLTFEMENQFPQAHHPVQESAMSLERVDTNCSSAASEITTNQQTNQV